jgi:TctA family transporter
MCTLFKVFLRSYVFDFLGSERRGDGFFRVFMVVFMKSSSPSISFTLFAGNDWDIGGALPSGSSGNDFLLPIAFHSNPVSFTIMLAGIYYGAMYGGSTTSILVNIPGEAASVITCLDGYQMARQGRAGPALGISAIGSFIGGTAGVIGLMLLAPPLAKIALKFGPPEYVSLILLSLIILSYITRGTMAKALMMALSASF